MWPQPATLLVQHLDRVRGLTARAVQNLVCRGSVLGLEGLADRVARSREVVLHVARHPNPFRGHAQWDLTPSAADPTGANINFVNMPAGHWTLRIFTIAGDLVQTLRWDDIQVNGKPQQETATDGQATWNLLSRNGQDVTSGIYLFSVESDLGTSQGKFVVIR